MILMNLSHDTETISIRLLSMVHRLPSQRFRVCGYFENGSSDDNLAFESGVRSRASGIRSTFLSVSALISQQLGDLSYTAVRLIILSARIIPISQKNQVRAASECE